MRKEYSLNGTQVHRRAPCTRGNLSFQLPTHPQVWGGDRKPVEKEKTLQENALKQHTGSETQAQA